MTRPILRAAPAALALLGTSAAAQSAAAQPAAAQPVPNARPLGAVTATIAEPFGGVQSLRQLPDGRVLINDPAKRRVILFDSALTKYTVVADSTSATANAYSGRIAGLIPYRGDSTLFVDPQSMSMLVIDPQGKLLERVMSVPRPDDAFALTGLAFGLPGFDAKGRLVYRANPSFNFVRNGPPGAGGPGGAPFTPPQMPDSAPIVRVELATRKVDTVTFVKTYAPKITMTQAENGRMIGSATFNPLPTVDDWAVLANGSVAVLRGRDFHVDLFGADGKVTSAPKVAHDWQRMSDEEKAAFLDSTKTAMEKQRAEMQARIQAAGGDPMRALAGAGGPGGPGGGMPMVSIRVEGGPGGEPPRRNAGGPNGTSQTFQLPPLNFVPASELPDYKPPFAAGGARGDADGNVWVRLIATKPMPGPVYDIIDRDGRLVDRVVLPPNSAIAGFGPGVVYLATRDADGTHLKRAKIK